MKWFRLYSEARTDAKLRTLSADQFRVWFNLLCFAAEQEDTRGSVIGYDADLLAVEVAEGDTELLLATLGKLEKLRVIAHDADDLHFLNFDRRQYDKPSDRPERVAARVRQHRERKRDERNAPVTPRNAVQRAYSEREEDPETERDPEQRDLSSGNGFSRERERNQPSSNRSRAQQPAQGFLSPSSDKPIGLARPAPPDASEPPPRTDAQLYDAVVEAFGYAPDTPVVRSEWAAWLRQLAQARASPDQVAERCLIYRQRYGDGIPLTLRALVRHWPELAPMPFGGSAHVAPAAATVASAELALRDRRRAEQERQSAEKVRLANELARELYGTSSQAPNGQSAAPAHVPRATTAGG